MRRLGPAVFVLLLCGSAAGQDSVTGVAIPVQADQIRVGDARISIFGIDAPDPDQDRECTLGGYFFGCYSNALRHLATMLDLGPVTCSDTGKRNYVNFPYMTCTVNGQDIGEAMVRAGHALAFLPQSDRYVEAEMAAKADKVGLWQPGVRFSLPWSWRVDHDRPLDGP